MAVKVIREIPFGAGNRGFRFENRHDRAADKKQYKKGVLLERARFRPGSVASRLFERLKEAA